MGHSALFSQNLPLAFDYFKDIACNMLRLLTYYTDFFKGQDFF